MSMINRQWSQKRPDEIDYRGIDWSAELASGENITAAGYSTLSGVVLSPTTILNTVTAVTISGGGLNSTASILGWIDTSKGRHLEVDITLPIR